MHYMYAQTWISLEINTPLYLKDHYNMALVGSYWNKYGMYIEQ